MSLFKLYSISKDIRDQSGSLQSIKKDLSHTPQLIGSQVLTAGLTMFQYNLERKELIQAEYRIGNNGRKQIYQQKHCLYVIAINKENAKKKIRKHLKLPPAYEL